MATRKARQEAIQWASALVRSTTNPFLRRARMAGEQHRLTCKKCGIRYYEK